MKPKGISKTQVTPLSTKASIQLNEDELTLQIEQNLEEEELSQFEQLKQLYNHALSTRNSVFYLNLNLNVNVTL